MDEIVKKVAALGLPGVILVITMAVTGLTGPAAIAAALVILGGPAGIAGGIALLGVTGLVAEGLSKVGFEDFLTAIYCWRRQRDPHANLLKEIDELPLFDGDVKQRLKATVIDGCGCSTAVTPTTEGVAGEAIERLNAVMGITPAHHRDFNNSRCIFTLTDETQVRTWKNLLGVDHVFLADANGKMIYGGFVGWNDSEELNRAISDIQQQFTGSNN